MMVLPNRERFRVARSRTPPPTENGGLPLAGSLRQVGAEKIARQSDCQLQRTQLRRRGVDFVEIG